RPPRTLPPIDYVRNRRPRSNRRPHHERGEAARRRSAPVLAATLRASRQLHGGEGSPPRREDVFRRFPVGLHQFRESEPLSPAAKTEGHRAQRGGTRASPSTPPLPGGAGGEQRRRARPGAAGRCV